MYVRNPSNGTDYEITQIHGSYQAIVMGVKPEKPVRKRRTKKKPVDPESED